RPRARLGAPEERFGPARDGRAHEPERARPGARAARLVTRRTRAGRQDRGPSPGPWEGPQPPSRFRAGLRRLPPMDDSVLASYRERISAADDGVLQAVNDRLRLVAELHALKRRSGLPLFDAAREQDVV